MKQAKSMSLNVPVRGDLEAESLYFLLGTATSLAKKQSSDCKGRPGFAGTPSLWSDDTRFRSLACPRYSSMWRR
jgi:hypothetical protein